MFTEQDAKKRYARAAEEAFQAAHGVSREKWVRQRMQKGTDPKAAEAESRRLMADLMEAKKDHMADVARRYMARIGKT